MDNAQTEEATALEQNVSKGWDRTDRVLRDVLGFNLRRLYDFKVKGTQNLESVEKKPTLFIANHVSYMDAVAVGVALAFNLRAKPAFVIDSGQHKYWTGLPVIGNLVKRLPLFPIDAKSSQALRGVVKLLKQNTPVVLFPEGRLTRTGTLMQTFDGAASVAESAGAQIVPIHLQGFEFLRGMTPDLKYYPKQFFPKLGLTFGAPKTLDIPEGLNPRERRATRLKQLDKIVHEIPLLSDANEQPLIEALRAASRNFGRNYRVLEDAENGSLSYGELLSRSYALEDKLRLVLDGEKPSVFQKAIQFLKRTFPRVTGLLGLTPAIQASNEPAIQASNEKEIEIESVGLLLPNSQAAATAFFALQAGNRLTAMLNPKAGIATMQSCAETAKIKTIVTSRRFVEMGKLSAEIEALSKTCKIVYLEDIRETVGTLDKVKAYLKMRGILTPPAPKSGKEPAVVLFTSGSEGVPKGVVLSAQNLLSNTAQVRSHVGFTPDDKVFNAMPLFHAFGLTGGMIMPIMSGVPSYQFPSPLEGKVIPKAIYFSDSTIMFGTDTFLNLYARTATGHDFSRIKMIFAGAERLTDSTYNLYVDKFGVRPNQGYGMTEAAPVVALNTREWNKKGSVGRLVPGMEARLEDVPGVTNGKRMFVRGPNVMLGYMKNDRPGVIQAPADGLHDTGDIVEIDGDDYVYIRGRVKRFAKIGGEMVSLDAVEEIAAHAAADRTAEHAVVLKQDPQQGDSLALFTTDPSLRNDDLTKTARAEQKSILGLPKNPDIHLLPSLPKLSTGKTDYVTLQKMLATDFAKAATGNAAEGPSLAEQPANDAASSAEKTQSIPRPAFE